MKTEIFVICIILLSFTIGTYFYPRMPDKVASHWNVQGQVDGYMSKFWGLFLMPIISVGLFLFFLVIPKIDPLKQNIQKFRKYFDGFIIMLIAFLFYLYLLTILWNIGFTYNMAQLLVPAFAILFYYMGILVEHSERNWFIGIRTPWTLSNNRVWYRTHRLGGKLFKIASVIALFGILFTKYAFWLVIIPVSIVVIYMFVYSYFEYRKQVK